MKRHKWTVVMRDETRGFQKTCDVAAVGVHQAITFAGDQLVRKGYDRADFQAIAVTRGLALQP